RVLLLPSFGDMGDVLRSPKKNRPSARPQEEWGDRADEGDGLGGPWRVSGTPDLLGGLEGARGAEEFGGAQSVDVGGSVRAHVGAAVGAPDGQAHLHHDGL